LEQQKTKGALREILEWVGLVLTALLIASVIQSELFALTEVNMSSMRDTLTPGDKLIMNKLSYIASEPKKGDIIIFLKDEPVDGILGRAYIYITDIAKKFNGQYRSNRLIKRVIGVPGDEIEIVDNVLYVNGEEYKEDYVRIDPRKGYVYNGEMEKITVPEGKLFVLGDNRGESSDSRDFGVIDMSWVEGKAIFRVFPFEKFGTIK